MDVLPPKGLVLSVHPGIPNDPSYPAKRVDFRGATVYSWFTLRMRRPPRGDVAEIRAELTYHVYGNDRVALVRVHVDPVQLEADEAMTEIKRLRPFDWWKRYALQQIAMQILSQILGDAAQDRGQYDAATGLWEYPEYDQAKEIHTARTITGTTPLARRVNRITDTHLAEVARIYTAAWSHNLPPTDAVRAHFGSSYSTAARWVGLARKASPPLLGPPTGPHGGTWERTESSDNRNESSHE